MALIANYGDLKVALSEWLMRDGDAALAARADAFIALFEAEFTLDPEMRTAEMQEIDTATLVGPAIALPDGYLEMVRLRLTGLTGTSSTQVLSYVTPGAASALDQTQLISGIAKNYTELAGQIFICPQAWAPVGATMEMAYYKFTQLKDAQSGTNWLLTKYPNIYLYGALMQAAAYVDDAVVAKWSTGLVQAMAKLAASDRKRKIGAGPLRMGASTGVV